MAARARRGRRTLWGIPVKAWAISATSSTKPYFGVTADDLEALSILKTPRDDKKTGGRLVLSAYDVFISYTKRKHAPEARAIAASLTVAGYSVWFDEQNLNRKTSWRMESKEELILLLKDAIHASRCVVLFAIEQEAISAPFDAERAKKAYQVIDDAYGKSLIACNWQIFEMRQAHHTLVLYESDDRRPEAVVARLVGMNIHPTRNKKAQKSLVKQTWVAIYRRLTRKRPVKALFTPLPRQDPGTRYDEDYLHALEDWIVVHLNMIKERTYSALIGEPGTGKTTLIDRIAASLAVSGFHRKGRAMLQVRLPALEDVDAWTKLAMKEPQDTIFVFDDLSA